MRHELPTGKQEEDEHEQAKSEKDQAFVRHPPEGGTRRHRARRNGRAKRHEQERDEKSHPVVGSAPDDQRTDHQTHHYRGKRERDRVCCVIAWRQAHPLERPCLPRRELQGESAGRPSIGSLQQCYIHREAGEEDRQGEDDQRKPYTSGEQEPAPMQVCIGCIGTLPGFRWRILNAHLYDPCVTPWFVLLYASVDFHYMPDSLFPSMVPEPGAHSHSPLTCWALRRTWGAISSRALSPPAKAAPAAGTSEFSPTGPKALREPGSWHLIQPFFAPV